MQIPKLMGEDPPALRDYIERHSGMTVVGTPNVTYTPVLPALMTPDGPDGIWMAHAHVMTASPVAAALIAQSRLDMHRNSECADQPCDTCVLARAVLDLLADHGVSD